MAPATSKVSIPFEEESALSFVSKKIICRVKNSCSGNKRKDTGKQINCHRHRACRTAKMRAIIVRHSVAISDGNTTPISN